MSNNIVVVGSSNVDLIIKGDKIPARGETVLGGTFYKAAGGKGANQAVAASRAAGDVFNGALAVAIAENLSLDEAIRFANAAAAVSVTRMGAQPSAPTRQEIDNML